MLYQKAFRLDLFFDLIGIFSRSDEERNLLFDLMGFDSVRQAIPLLSTHITIAIV